MVNVRLEDKHGTVVHNCRLAPFHPQPEILRYRGRYYVVAGENAGAVVYRDAFLYAIPDDPGMA